MGVFKKNGEAAGEEFSMGVRIEVSAEGVTECGLDATGKTQGVNTLMMEGSEGIASCFGEVWDGGKSRSSFGERDRKEESPSQGE